MGGRRKMNKKIIGILVCTLLILTAIPAVGIMNIKTDNAATEHESASPDPIPDLECSGDIELYNVKPGIVIHSQFFVANKGEEGSLLDWEIVEWPDWGTWTFDPEKDYDLPDGNSIAVGVTIVVPDDAINELLEGEVKVVNMDNPDDYDTINIKIHTARVHSSSYPSSDEPVERFSTQSKSASSDPEPKICSSGAITLVDVKPGKEIHDNFQVSNCGDEGSLLDWKIESWPDWGREWEFTPESGNGLLKYQWKTVYVSFKVPDDYDTEFEGNITVVNMDDPGDYGIINVYISTVRVRSSSYPFLEQFPLLARLFSLPIFTRLLNLK